MSGVEEGQGSALQRAKTMPSRPAGPLAPIIRASSGLAEIVGGHRAVGLFEPFDDVFIGRRLEVLVPLPHGVEHVPFVQAYDSVGGIVECRDRFRGANGYGNYELRRVEIARRALCSSTTGCCE